MASVSVLAQSNSPSMKKILIPTLALLVTLPATAHAASAAFFGPIVSEACRCAGTAPTYGCILDTGQRMINFGITIGIVAFTFALAYAGFVWMTSGGNPEARSKGRSMLINVFVGLFILLTAWLIVDFVMKQLYSGDNGSKDFGPWNSILADSGTTMCIEETKPSAIAGTGIGGAIARGLTTEMAGTGSQLKPPATTGGFTGTTFTYDPGIVAQKKDASGALATALSCMAGKLPKGVGRISSISDSKISSGAKTFAQCAAGGCSHVAHSCHYGGRTCIGQSYAADFGDDEHISVLTQAAQACGAKTLNEGNHLHISVGQAAGCGCSL